MDITTLYGFIAFILMIATGLYLRELPEILLNMHALLLVIGGSLVAIMINTPRRYVKKATQALKMIILEGEEDSMEKLIPYVVDLADKARKDGLKALKTADNSVAGGFLKRVCDAAVEYSDSQFVKKIIEQEINQAFDDQNEISNVYRTMSVLSPMFGLIGTLLGIIGVLKDLTNPESVGPAMAVAITSAFYGILLANIVFTPIAGKLRSKALMQIKLKEMILEGVLEITKGSIPMMVERRMRSFSE